MKARQKITLPSGGVCMVRKVSGRDFIAGGLAPVISELKIQRAKRAAGPARTEDAPIDMREVELVAKCQTMMLCRCVGEITFPGDEKVRIVDKPFDQCSDSEISIEEIDQEDANFLAATINRLSGLTKEAAVAAAPFPEGQAPAAGVAPDSEGIRLPADSAPGAEPV